MQQEKVHVRLLLIAGVVLLWMLCIFGRVAYLQLFLHSDYLAKASRQQRRTLPARGHIGGTEIAYSGDPCAYRNYGWVADL